MKRTVFDSPTLWIRKTLPYTFNTFHIQIGLEIYHTYYLDNCVERLCVDGYVCQT